MEAKGPRKACRAASALVVGKQFPSDFAQWNEMVELFQFFRWHRGRSIDINFSQDLEKVWKKVLCFVAHEREICDDPSSCWFF